MWHRELHLLRQEASYVTSACNSYCGVEGVWPCTTNRALSAWRQA